MSKTHSRVTMSPISSFFKETEARFFAAKAQLNLVRYEVVVYMNGEAMVGTITTVLPLDAYLHEHGMILQSLSSHHLAPPGSEAGHDLI